MSEAVRRLRRAAKRSAFQTPFQEALVGRVCLSRVVLQRHRPWRGSGLGPAFVGRFVQHADHVALEGAFTLHPLARWITMLWASCLGMFLAVVLVRVATQPPAGDEALLLALLLALFLYWAGLLGLARRLGRTDIPYIESAVARALRAAPPGTPGPSDTPSVALQGSSLRSGRDSSAGP